MALSKEGIPIWILGIGHIGHKLQAMKLCFVLKRRDYELTRNRTANTYPCVDLVLKCPRMRRDAFTRMIIDWRGLTASAAPLSISVYIT